MVPERLCARCHEPVAVSGGALTFCPHCGAAQVFLSEEARERVADQARRFAEAQHPQPAAPAEEDDASAGQAAARPRYRPAEPGGVLWSTAIQSALLVGAIAGGLGLGSFALPPISLFCLIWAALAPVAALRFYHARVPDTQLTAEFGARMGLLAAVFVALGTMAVYTPALLLMRFAFHAAGPLDAAMAAWAAQSRAAVIQQQGAAAAQPVLWIFDLP